jgi:sugar (pentulose or hexulose) kinase
MISSIEDIRNGECTLGIEFGSTRVKSVLIDSNHHVLASGTYNWQSKNFNGVWSYEENDILFALKVCYRDLKLSVKKQYGIILHDLRSIGISGMMHGIIACDSFNNFIIPFRTWRCNITQSESKDLTGLFNYPIPQRWTIAHLLKLVNEKIDISKFKYVSTLSSYIHRLLTDKNVIGLGDASGMFPIKNNDYDEYCVNIFDKIMREKGYDFSLRDIFPEIVECTERAGYLTKNGSMLLDESGDLNYDIPFCPPEGDAQTGMIATNSVAQRSGNVSAGTSVFSMIVLEHPLSKIYKNIDLITTPEGSFVAMVHSNNCTGEYDSWVGLFKEMIDDLKLDIGTSEIYEYLLNKALEGTKSCEGLMCYPYVSGEHITGLEEGRPLVIKKDNSVFNLANFMRAQLYSSLCAMKLGLNTLYQEENIVVETITCHGGFFKTKRVGGLIMSSAMNHEIQILDEAGEGGAYGIAILSQYSLNENKSESLSDFLNREIFADQLKTKFFANDEEIDGFNEYLERYLNTLDVEKRAVEIF